MECPPSWKSTNCGSLHFPFGFAQGSVEMTVVVAGPGHFRSSAVFSCGMLKLDVEEVAPGLYLDVAEVSDERVVV